MRSWIEEICNKNENIHKRIISTPTMTPLPIDISQLVPFIETIQENFSIVKETLDLIPSWYKQGHGYFIKAINKTFEKGH